MASLGSRKTALFAAPFWITVVGLWSCAKAHGGQAQARSTASRQSHQLVLSAGQDNDLPSTKGSCATVLWCASGGAALVGEPVLDKHERVYAATSDGYLHAFERDGRFRFSYTVQGTPLGSVSLRV